MKKIITLLLSVLFTCCLFVNVKANDVKIIDDDNVLSESEKNELNELINNYINHTNYDMVVYFADKGDEYFYNKTITDLADDTFDYNDYGIGDDKEGIILCFDIKYRDYTITTSGNSCISTYSYSALESIYDNVTPYFRENNFFGGAKEFIERALFAYDNYDMYHQEDTYDDIDIIEKKDNGILRSAIISLIGSGIITLVAFIILSSKLKSQKVSTTADQYIKKSNLNIFKSGDIYLYSNIRRTKIERNINKSVSGSSSPTHISSSGHTHGGGGSHRV